MKKKANRKSPLPMASPAPKSTIVRNKKPTTTTVSDSETTIAIASISDLKNMASTRFSHLNSNLIDHSHTQILKDFQAFHSRLHKHFKIQSQTCQQVIDEAEKEFKKMSERINESCEAIKESYEELMADAQATTSRVCKTTIPELSRSYEKAIGDSKAVLGFHQLNHSMRRYFEISKCSSPKISKFYSENFIEIRTAYIFT